MGFGDLIAQHITDPRGKNTQFPLTDLVRQSVYRRLAGYERYLRGEEFRRQNENVSYTAWIGKRVFRKRGEPRK